MRRFYAPQTTGERVVLPREESRHAATVLRLRPGDRVEVFDGRGGEYVVELTAVAPDAVEGRVVEARPAPAARVAITLAQGVPKGSKMDAVVRMGTELGITAFVPVLTRRTVGRPSAARVQRWRRVAVAAAKQSGRVDVPSVDDAVALQDLWGRLRGHLTLLPWEGLGAPLIGAALAAVRVDERRGPVAIVIGPEGGLAEEEVAEAARHGAHVVSLGPLILRTETAGVVAAAIVTYELALRP